MISGVVLNITIITVGKIKEKYLIEGIKEYSKRLGRFCNLKILEVSDEKIPGSLNSLNRGKILGEEGNKIEKVLKSISVSGRYVVSLDVKGVRYNSERLAEEISSLMSRGISHIVFIIGGSLGLDDNILNMSELRLSMSDMTFTHQMIRFFLLEQIYRVFKILNNETYHK